MSYLPNTMDNFENIENALDEIRNIESTWSQELDDSWSQSTTSVQSSPQEASRSPPTVVEEAPQSKRTPPWNPDNKPADIVLPLHPVRQAVAVQPITRPIQTIQQTVQTPETIYRDSVRKRSRTQFSTYQLVSLEKSFAQSVYISRAQRSALARELALTEKQIKIWFQNRRMKENKVFKGKVTGPKAPNRIAATAVKNLQRLAEKQNDQNIVSRLMSQRQVAPPAFPSFASGEEVHRQAFQPYAPPPPYPTGSQYQQPFYHQDNFYDHHHVYRPEQYEPISYQDHGMEHMMEYPMLLNEMPSTTIAWGQILDRQLTV